MLRSAEHAGRPYPCTLLMMVGHGDPAEERPLGFDARVPWSTLAPWSPARRQTYLLRIDAEPVLSADPLVWPAALPAAPAVPSYDVSGQLWAGLDPLRRRLEDHNFAPATSPTIVAITLFAEAVDADRAPDSDMSSPMIPEDWPLLGYDVTDGGLLSGLSNCGYSAADAAILRPRWGPLLNRFHLFNDPAAALQFRIVTDERVPEHAPFIVVGLRVVFSPVAFPPRE